MQIPMVLPHYDIEQVIPRPMNHEHDWIRYTLPSTRADM